MADTKAKPVTETERKKPVRKAPKLSDYPTRLAWLKAMTEYEEAQAKAETDAKVARLDKRIDRLLVERRTIDDTLDRLKAERRALVGETVEVEVPEPEGEALPA